MEQWRTLARLGKVIHRPETGEVVIEGVVLNVERFKKSIRKELETLVSILHNDILLKVSLEDVGVNMDLSTLDSGDTHTPNYSPFSQVQVLQADDGTASQSPATRLFHAFLQSHHLGMAETSDGTISVNPELAKEWLMKVKDATSSLCVLIYFLGGPPPRITEVEEWNHRNSEGLRRNILLGGSPATPSHLENHTTTSSCASNNITTTTTHAPTTSPVHAPTSSSTATTPANTEEPIRTLLCSISLGHKGYLRTGKAKEIMRFYPYSLSQIYIIMTEVIRPLEVLILPLIGQKMPATASVYDAYNWRFLVQGGKAYTSKDIRKSIFDFYDRHMNLHFGARGTRQLFGFLDRNVIIDKTIIQDDALRVKIAELMEKQAGRTYEMGLSRYGKSAVDGQLYTPDAHLAYIICTSTHKYLEIPTNAPMEHFLNVNTTAGDNAVSTPLVSQPTKKRKRNRGNSGEYEGARRQRRATQEGGSGDNDQEVEWEEYGDVDYTPPANLTFNTTSNHIMTRTGQQGSDSTSFPRKNRAFVEITRRKK